MVKVKLLSHVQLFATPWTVAYQAPLSMGFSRQEYWSGLPFPSPGDLPDPEMEPRASALQEDALPSEPLGKPTIYFYFLPHPHSMWDFSSLTRDGTPVPSALEGGVLSTEPLGKSQISSFFNSYLTFHYLGSFLALVSAFLLCSSPGISSTWQTVEAASYHLSDHSTNIYWIPISVRQYWGQLA